MYIIIVGAGRIGKGVINVALKDNNNIVLVEKKEELAKELAQSSDITVIHGDATIGETLKEAGAERADCLIATTSDDAVNLMIVSVAQRLRISSIFTVVNDQEHTDLFQNKGIKTIEKPTEMIIAQYIYNAIKQPQLKNLVILPQGGQVFYLTVTADSPLVGETLATTKKKKIILSKMTIIAIKREGKREIAEDNTVIMEKDGITLFSLEKISDSLIEKLTGQNQ